MKVTLSTLAEVLAAQRRAAKPAKSPKKPTVSAESTTALPLQTAESLVSS
ncbi:hypothetical protein [Hymenobacter sp. 102]